MVPITTAAEAAKFFAAALPFIKFFAAEFGATFDDPSGEIDGARSDHDAIIARRKNAEALNKAVRSGIAAYLAGIKEVEAHVGKTD